MRGARCFLCGSTGRFQVLSGSSTVKINLMKHSRPPYLPVVQRQTTVICGCLTGAVQANRAPRHLRCHELLIVADTQQQQKVEEMPHLSFIDETLTADVHAQGWGQSLVCFCEKTLWKQHREVALFPHCVCLKAMLRSVRLHRPLNLMASVFFLKMCSRVDPLLIMHDPWLNKPLCWGMGRHRAPL